jgi:hypothetical protein
LLREDEDEDEDEDDVAAKADEEARAEAELDSAAAAVGDGPAAEAFAFGSEITCMADSATVVATQLLAGTRVTVRPMAVKQKHAVLR